MDEKDFLERISKGVDIIITLLIILIATQVYTCVLNH